MNFELLRSAPRLLFEAPLKPLQGDRFQPTGFADIGAAVYTRPAADGSSGTQMLLVESAQSVANRLERTCLDGDGPDIAPELRGIPYVKAKLIDAALPAIETSSLIEPHRLASPYFLRSEFKDTLAKELSYTGKEPLNWKQIYRVLFKYDPNCLIHGVFLSLLNDGRVRVQRALSGFIEAENVQQVTSGGVKNSPVDPTGQIQVQTGAVEKGIYSNVPYSRVEYAAAKITAYFNLDLGQIRSYGLTDPAAQMLTLLSLLKVRRFLDSDLRLRTACQFGLASEVRVSGPLPFSLPQEDELLSDLQKAISDCQSQFASPAVTELAVKVAVKKAKADEKSVTKADEGGTE